jgi:NAD+ kinase
MLQYQRVGVTVKTGLENRNETVSEVVSILEGAGATVLFDARRSEGVDCANRLAAYHDERDIDLLVVIGGDGTILRAVRELPECGAPIVGVNRGVVGFLAEMELAETSLLLPRFLHGEGIIEQRSVLEVSVVRRGETLPGGRAINEAVIAQGTIARLVSLGATINGNPLTEYQADGLIIATPTGSTAYSLAAGGPIVHPGLEAIILTPINPYSFSQKPIVVRGDSVVEVTVGPRQPVRSDARVFLTLDGQTSQPLEPGDVVRATVSPCPVKFLRRHQHTFFETIRDKLQWGARIQ